ncbi:MAG: OsmC family protein [Candidatus Kapaibacterium sp.]
MDVKLSLDGKMRIKGTNELGLETYFDTNPNVGGENTAATPMEVMLQAMAACAFMDTVSILRKKRKQVDNLEIEVHGERKKEHPKMFTKVHMKFILTSPDSELSDLERSIYLSQTTYCGASALFQAAGCEVSWEKEIKRPVVEA